MIIRRALPGDVPALAGVAVAAYRQGFGGFVAADVLARRNAPFFVARFLTEWATVTIVEDNGHLLGFAQTKPQEGGGLYLAMLFVAPEAQGKGVGRKLLAEAEKRGTRTLECFEKNTLARAFYERAGWRETQRYNRDFAGVEEAFVWYEKD